MRVRAENAVVVSVDGVGAYDLKSRKSMFSGLIDMRDGEQLLPFARIFHGEISTYLWENDVADITREKVENKAMR